MNRRRILDFIRNDFQFYIFIIFTIALPFTKEYLPHVTFAWVVSATFSARKIRKDLYKSIYLLYFPVIFYLLNLIGLFYTKHIDIGLFDLEKKLSIFFIPLVVVFITDKVRINHRVILKVFVFTNFIVSIVCLAYAFKQSIGVNELGNYYFESSHWPTVTEGFGFIKLINYRYSNFSHSFLSLFQHPSYFSAFILFSIAIIIYLFKTTQRKKIGYLSLIGYFTIFIWLLGSRAAYVTYLISFLGFSFFIVFKYKKYWIAFTVLGIGIFISIMVLSNRQFSKNINETGAVIEGSSLNKDSDIRLWLWKSGYEVFKDHFWFGVGTGDADEKMNEKYRTYDLTLAKEHNYNTHNQYLDVAVKLGLVGLVILIGWLIFTIYITIKKKQFLFFYFILIIAINFFFEAFLNSIAGISFFTFFYSLLYSVYNIDTKKEIV